MPPLVPPPAQIDSPRALATAPGGYRHFVIATILYLFLCQCGVLFRGIPIALAGFADFRSFYTAGFMVRTGSAHQLYDYDLQRQVQSAIVAPRPVALPFIYPAYAALLFVPLSMLGYRAAYFLFLAVNLLLLWLSARLMRDSLPQLSALWTPLPMALFFGFFPASVALIQGQTSMLLLALYCAAFASLRKANPLRAGIFLGLAIMKIQIALPVALLFLLWRRWRVAVGFLAGAAAALAVSLCVTGPAAFVQYWRSLFLMAASASGSTAQFCIPPAMMPNLNGFAQVLSGGAPWGAHLAAAISALIFLGLAARPQSLPMALVGALLGSRYLGIHDLLLLILPLALVLNQAAANPLAPRARYGGTMLCLILMLPPVYLFLMGKSLIDWLAPILLAFLFFLALPAAREPSAQSA